MKSPALAWSLAAVLFIACATEVTEVAPDPAEPSFIIEDGAHGGKSFFFLLPPLVPSPTFSGVPNGTVLGALSVEVCDLGTARPSGTSCVGKPIVASYTSTGGFGGEAIGSGEDGTYHVNWHTDQSQLRTTNYYRLRVLIAATELGQADIDVLSNGRDLKNYDTGNSIPLVNGRTLPIKFRVEKNPRGAVGVAASGPDAPALIVSTPATPSGVNAELSLPAGQTITGTGPAGGAVALTIESTTLPATVPSSGVLASTAYEFGPSGATFSSPVTITLGYNPATLGGIPEAKLRLYTVGPAGTLQFIAGSGVNLTAHTVSGNTTHFSTYVVGQQATVTIRDSDSPITLELGGSVPFTADIDPPGRAATWNSSDPEVASVDQDGVVTSHSSGTTTVTATVDDISDQATVIVASMEGGSDTDADGVANSADNCPIAANPDQADFNSDGTGDMCADTDNDGYSDWAELTQWLTNPTKADSDDDGWSDYEEITSQGTHPMLADTDGDGVIDTQDPHPLDRDNDGVNDGTDNCPIAANPDQADFNGDGTGDMCADLDNDGFSDWAELTNWLTNPAKVDSDDDGFSDWEEIARQGTHPMVADTDGDGVLDGQDAYPLDPSRSVRESNPLDGDDDGVLDATDNCPIAANPDQADFNSDGTGDMCADTDNDGYSDWAELTQWLTNPAKADSDDDGWSDYEEITSQGTHPMLADTDGDGVIDTQDPNPLDRDNDGVNDATDNCPIAANPDQADFNGDGTGDMCADLDNDGYSDWAELTHWHTNPAKLDSDDDGFSDWEEITRQGTDPMTGDTDGDGVLDGQDAYPLDPTRSA